MRAQISFTTEAFWSTTLMTTHFSVRWVASGEDGLVDAMATDAKLQGSVLLDVIWCR